MERAWLEALVRAGRLDAEEAAQAEGGARAAGVGVDTWLLLEGRIDEASLLDVFRDAYGDETLGRTSITEQAALRALPEPWALRHRLAPLGWDKTLGELTVLSRVPPDRPLLERLGTQLGLKIRPILGPEARVEQRLQQLYGRPPSPGVATLVERWQERRELRLRLAGARELPPMPAPSEKVGVVPIDGAIARLSTLESRDAIVEALLDVARREVAFGAFLAVTDGRATGWAAVGEGSENIGRVTVDEPESCFMGAVATAIHHLGPLETVDLRALAVLERPSPRAALIVPIRVRDRVVALLYAENGSRAIPPRAASDLVLVASYAGQALERLVLRRKAVARGDSVIGRALMAAAPPLPPPTAPTPTPPTRASSAEPPAAPRSSGPSWSPRPSREPGTAEILLSEFARTSWGDEVLRTTRGSGNPETPRTSGPQVDATELPTLAPDARGLRLDRVRTSDLVETELETQGPVLVAVDAAPTVAPEATPTPTPDAVAVAVASAALDATPEALASPAPAEAGSGTSPEPEDGGRSLDPPAPQLGGFEAPPSTAARPEDERDPLDAPAPASHPLSAEVQDATGLEPEARRAQVSLDAPAREISTDRDDPSSGAGPDDGWTPAPLDEPAREPPPARVASRDDGWTPVPLDEPAPVPGPGPDDGWAQVTGEASAAARETTSAPVALLPDLHADPSRPTTTADTGWTPVPLDEPAYTRPTASDPTGAGADEGAQVPIEASDPSHAAAQAPDTPALDAASAAAPLGELPAPTAEVGAQLASAWQTLEAELEPVLRRSLEGAPDGSLPLVAAYRETGPAPRAEEANDTARDEARADLEGLLAQPASAEADLDIAVDDQPLAPRSGPGLDDDGDRRLAARSSDLDAEIAVDDRPLAPRSGPALDDDVAVDDRFLVRSGSPDLDIAVDDRLLAPRGGPALDDDVAVDERFLVRSGSPDLDVAIDDRLLAPRGGPELDLAAAAPADTAGDGDRPDRPDRREAAFEDQDLSPARSRAPAVPPWMVDSEVPRGSLSVPPLASEPPPPRRPTLSTVGRAPLPSPRRDLDAWASHVEAAWMTWSRLPHATGRDLETELRQIASGGSLPAADLRRDAWVRASSRAPRTPSVPARGATPRPVLVVEPAPDLTAELSMARPFRSTPAPSATTELARPGLPLPFDEAQALLDALEGPDPERSAVARQAILARAEELRSFLVRRFPGRVVLDPFADGARLGPFASAGPLLSVIAELGTTVSRDLAARLDDPLPLVRYFALYAFTVFSPADHMLRVARRLHDEEQEIRALALELVRQQRGQPSINVVLNHLRQRLESPSPLARKHAARLIGAIQDKEVVPLLIPMLERKERAVVEATEDALAELTKQRLGPSARRWSEWWSAHRDEPRAVWLLAGLDAAEPALRRSAAEELRALSGFDPGFEAEGPRRPRDEAKRRWTEWWALQTGRPSS